MRVFHQPVSCHDCVWNVRGKKTAQLQRIRWLLSRENPAVPVLEGLHFFFFGRCIVLPNILQNLAGNIALVLMFLSELQISLCTDAVYKRGAARLPANCSCVGVSFGSTCAGSSSPGCWDPSAGTRGHRQDAGG